MTTDFDLTMVVLKKRGEKIDRLLEAGKFRWSTIGDSLGGEIQAICLPVHAYQAWLVFRYRYRTVPTLGRGGIDGYVVPDEVDECSVQAVPDWHGYRSYYPKRPTGHPL